MQRKHWPTQISLVTFILGMIVALAMPYLLVGAEQQALRSSNPSSSSLLGNTYIIERDIMYTGNNSGMSLSDITRHRVYVSFSNEIVVYDTNTGATIATINIQFPGRLALSADGSQLIVSKQVNPYSAGLITVIDTSTFQITDQHIYPYYPGGTNSRSLIDMAVGPGNRLYMAPPQWSNYAIDVMDLDTGNIVASIPLGTYPDSLAFTLEIAPGNQFLYLWGSLTYPPAPLLLKYDISDVQPVQVDSEPVPFEDGTFVIASDGSFILLGDPSYGNINKYETTSLGFVDSWSVHSSYYGLELSGDNQNFHLAHHDPGGAYGPSWLLTYSATDGTQLREYVDLPGVQLGRRLLTLANDQVAIIYSDRLRIFRPADYGVALPFIAKDACMVPIVDDFDDPTSGWPVTNTNTALYGYTNGEYNIFMKVANAWAGATAGHVWENSRRLEVQGRILQNNGFWGLILGLNSDWSEFYTFEVWPDQQRWFVWHFTTSQGWALVRDSSNSAINTGAAYNTLRLEYGGGDDKHLFINNNHLTILALPEGRVGLSASAIDANVDIRYDNYVFVGENCPFPTFGTQGTTWFEQERSLLVLERPPLETFLPQE